MPGPLEGLRVLEVAEGVAAPYAGRLLAMLGAEVVKLEPPGGDATRTLPVDDLPPAHVPGPLFCHLNAGTRSAAADGDADMATAVAWADVVLTDRVARQLAGTPLDLDALRAADAPLVLATLTAWGADADDPGWPTDELVVQAASGAMTDLGEEGLAPRRFPGWQSQYLAGAYAAAAVLAAAGRPGFHHVDVAWVDAVLTGVESGVSRHLYDVTMPVPVGGRPGTTPPAFPGGAFRCADGYVVPGAVRPADWEIQCRLYGRPDLLEDPRYDRPGRWRHREALAAEIQPWYDARTKREIFAAALEARWAAAMVVTARDALADPHLATRGFLVPLEGAAPGAVAPGRFCRLDGVPGPGPLPVPAAPGADPAPRGPRSGLRGPDLAGVRVLELTFAWAGPFVGRFLALFGADVVKVEAGRYPDGWRTALPWGRAGVPVPEGVDPAALTWDLAPLHNGLNRDKRSASVDLGAPGGREAFLALVAAADVLVVNTGAGVLAERGVEDDVLAATERGLVVCRMPALGATGPYRDLLGYGTLVEGMGGLAARFGDAEDGADVTPTYFPDCVAGVHATVAVLAGLVARARTGRGLSIDLSHQETMWCQLGEGLVLASAEGREPRRTGAEEPGTALSGIYMAADGWVAVVARGDDDAAAVGAVGGDLGSWAVARPGEEVVAAVHAAGGLAAVVRDYRAHGVPERMVHTLDHPLAGRRAYLGSPVVVDGRRLAHHRAAPCFGVHSDEVLAEWTGADGDRVAGWRASGAVGTVPTTPRR